MEFHLTAVQEAALREVAAQNGAKVEDLVRDAVDQMLSHDAWFKNQVQVGLDQIERGDVVPPSLNPPQSGCIKPQRPLRTSPIEAGSGDSQERES